MLDTGSRWSGVASVLCVAVVAACGSGDPTMAPADAVRQCGDDASIELIDELPIGREFRDGEDFSVRVRYELPHCESFYAIFDGYHARGTPWYEHWCTDPEFIGHPCGDTIGSAMPAGGETIRGDGGFVRLRARPGSFPPFSLAAPPNMEGFTLCGVLFYVHAEGVFEPYRHALGDRCWGKNVPAYHE